MVASICWGATDSGTQLSVFESSASKKQLLIFKAGVRRFPAMVPDHADAPGAALSRRAREWLKTQWAGETFMAIGMQDPVLGPPVMHHLRKLIRGCPAPYEIAEAGHFVQEWGDDVAQRALTAFGI
jgi:pimeloyl-ACP methyl ester carboxylesterase